MNKKKQPNGNGESRNLFVYGTLMKGYGLHRFLNRPDVSFLGRGRIRAKLFELPDESYPAAIPDQSTYTYGELYRLEKPNQILALIDEVEECSEGLFKREMVTAWERGMPKKAWTYFFGRSLDNAKEIPGGDYRKFSAA